MSETSSPDFTPAEHGAANEPVETDATRSSEQDSTPYDPTALLAFGAMQVDTRELVRTLFAIFDQHAWLALGLIADPRTGEPRTDLPAAQLAIDCAHFILGKVDAELTEGERRDAHRRLNDLRVNYLTKLKESSGA